MVCRFAQEKNTLLGYTSRVARIYRIKLRLKKAQMILSLGSNRFKLVKYGFVFIAFCISAQINVQEKYIAALDAFCKDFSH